MADEQDIFGGNVDPEIANLLDMDLTPKKPSKSNAGQPDFNSLFGKADSSDQEDMDVSKKSFDPIVHFEEKAKPFFKDPKYYQKVLTGEGETSKRLHQFLASFLNSTDPKDRSMYRMKILPVFWDVYGNIATKVGPELSIQKRLFLRFNIVLPTLLSPEQRDMISKIIFKNDTDEPVHYADEWLEKIAYGQVNPLGTDEVKVSKQNKTVQVKNRVDKVRGQRDSYVTLIKGKMGEIEQVENQLKEKINALSKTGNKPGYNMRDQYSPDQRKSLSVIVQTIHKLSRLDKEAGMYYKTLADYEGKVKELEGQAQKMGGDLDAVDAKTVTHEANSLRQLTKLCVGRQGNHFPILMKAYFRPMIREIATRENVLSHMAMVERLDPGLFLRTFKRQTTRIVPHVILLSCYGDRGMCWEPFEKSNRASSRGRIGIPIFPKELKLAIISALADLRWQVAKEKAQHYWMEEGLTGWYYQWFSERKMKGDVRESFINDYILWITKESEGMQKLDKEIRGIFWRNMPFPQDIKDMLRNKGFAYSELYKKDKNIKMSDGY